MPRLPPMGPKREAATTSDLCHLREQLCICVTPGVFVVMVCMRLRSALSIPSRGERKMTFKPQRLQTAQTCASFYVPVPWGQTTKSSKPGGFREHYYFPELLSSPTLPGAAGAAWSGAHVHTWPVSAVGGRQVPPPLDCSTGGLRRCWPPPCDPRETETEPCNTLQIIFVVVKYT